MLSPFFPFSSYSFLSTLSLSLDLDLFQAHAIFFEKWQGKVLSFAILIMLYVSIVAAVVKINQAEKATRFVFFTVLYFLYKYTHKIKMLQVCFVHNTCASTWY